MHNGELYGRVIRCNYGQPQRIKDGSAQPVWADADRYEAERAADEAESGRTRETPWRGWRRRSTERHCWDVGYLVNDLAFDVMTEM